jgi:hypothetical protein
MPVTPAEIQTQWANALKVFEDTRNFSDTSIVNDGGALDVLYQSLEGEYTPDGLTAAGEAFRSALSALASPATAFSFLEWCVREYGTIINSARPGVQAIFADLYEYFHDNSLSVLTRGITYAAAVADGSNVGNVEISRLTEDHEGYDLEFCYVEEKMWRCIRDQNSNHIRWAEEFEVLGSSPSKDQLLRGSRGSGSTRRATARVRHSGPSTGNGGTVLANASFQTYDGTVTGEVFANWLTVSGEAGLSQAADGYMISPGTNDSLTCLSMAQGAHGDMEIRQPLTLMSTRKQLRSMRSRPGGQR